MALSAEEKKQRHKQKVTEWKRKNQERVRNHRMRYYGELDESKALPRLHQNLKQLTEEQKQQRVREHAQEWRERHPDLVQRYMEVAEQRRKQRLLGASGDTTVAAMDPREVMQLARKQKEFDAWKVAKGE